MAKKKKDLPKKRCLYDNKWFQPNSAEQKYCSRKHAGLHSAQIRHNGKKSNGARHPVMVDMSNGLDNATVRIPDEDMEFLREIMKSEADAIFEAIAQIEEGLGSLRAIVFKIKYYEKLFGPGLDIKSLFAMLPASIKTKSPSGEASMLLRGLFQGTGIQSQAVSD